MNVLLLTQFFSQTRGGGEYIFKILADSLVKNNHKVWIVTNEITGEKYETHENLKIIFVKPTLSYDSDKLPQFSDSLRYCINATRIALGIIKKEKIDIIHSNNFAPALSGAVLGSITSRPHILTIYDIFSLCRKDFWQRWGEQNSASWISVLLGPFFEKLILKLKHDGIHTISEATRDDLVSFGAKKPVHVIPPTIDLHHEDQDFTINPLQFVYIGRLVFYKNLEVVIRAIKIVRDMEPNVKLVVVGNGPHKKYLEGLIENLGLQSNVEFRGYVDEVEKTSLIGNSNAMVFPSTCEGFGLVILEAFSFGRPVLVSDIRPMSDIVIDKKNGHVLDPQDERCWAEQMLRIIKKPSDASTMGKNGKELLRKSYSQELMYHKVIDMYTGVLS
ncbi:MAG: glycosyltransferase family 4 protein [Nitrososphaerales archaeon]